MNVIIPCLGALVAFVKLLYLDSLKAGGQYWDRRMLRVCFSTGGCTLNKVTPGLLALSCVLILSLADSMLAAQQESAPASPNYSITASVRRVIVDVVAMSPEGELASNLSEKDFSIAENGVSQTILSFEAHNNDSSTQTLPPNLPINTFVNLPRVAEAGPLYLLLYDMANTDTAGQMFARKQLVKFINERPSGTRFAIFALSDGLHLVQGFTADKQLLSAALDVNGKTPHMPIVFLYGGIYHPGYPQVMKQVVKYLDGLPGRKNVIWVSSDYPFALFAPDPPELIEATRKELIVMAASQISIYPVDTDGIEGVNKKTATLDEVAWETGGHAFYNSNDIAGSLNKAVAEGGTYYTLSYSSTNREYDGKLRHIEVKLSKGSTYNIDYRREYYAAADAPEQTQIDRLSTADDATTRPASKAIDSLSTFVRHGMPIFNEILFSAHPREVGTPKLANKEQMEALFMKSEGLIGGLQAVTLQSYAIAYAVPVRQFRLTSDASNTSPHILELAAAAYDSEGRLLISNVVHAAASPDGKSKYYQVVQPFDVPTSARWICVAVRDAENGRIGNLEFAVPLAPEPPAK